jgi:hypothetical protein
MGNGNALLVEEVALDPVRIAQHLHRSLAHVRQDALGDVDVVADEVALRGPEPREEDLVEVGERHLSPADDHERRVRSRITLRGEGAGGGSRP